MFVETQETNDSTAPSAPCSPTPRGPTAETTLRHVTSQTRSTTLVTCVMPPSPRRAPGRCTSQRSTTPSGSRSRPCNSLHRLIPKYRIEQRTFPLFFILAQPLSWVLTLVCRTGLSWCLDCSTHDESGRRPWSVGVAVPWLWQRLQAQRRHVKTCGGLSYHSSWLTVWSVWESSQNKRKYEEPHE